MAWYAPYDVEEGFFEMIFISWSTLEDTDPGVHAKKIDGFAGVPLAPPLWHPDTMPNVAGSKWLAGGVATSYFRHA